MNTGKYLWLFIFITSLSLSGWYFTKSTRVVILNKNNSDILSDTIIQDLTVQQFDAQGQLVSFLRTPFMQHSDSKYHLQDPYVFLMENAQSNWEIRAKEAIAINSGKKIIFEKNVIIHQAASNDTPESILTTEKIIYYPEKKLATTPLLITFKRPGSTVTAQGMKAYLADKKVVLLKHAQAIYQNE